MKNLVLLLAATLFLLCCACTPTVDAPEGGDGYIPVAGLSFGMSIEEAMDMYPGLKEVEALRQALPGEVSNGHPKFFLIPGATDFLLENAKVLGESATVRLRFMSWLEQNLPNVQA